MADANRHNKKSQRPFEAHIESRDFDIDPLSPDDAEVTCDALHPRLEELLDSLPQPLDEGNFVWDNLIDDMQDQLRACLSIEIIDRVIRPNFDEWFEDVSDDELSFFLTFPVTLAMIALEYFRKNGYPEGWDKPTDGSQDSESP